MKIASESRKFIGGHCHDLMNSLNRLLSPLDPRLIQDDLKMIQNEDLLFQVIHLNMNGIRHIYWVKCSIVAYVMQFIFVYFIFQLIIIICLFFPIKILISQLHHIYEVNNTSICIYFSFYSFFFVN